MPFVSATNRALSDNANPTASISVSAGDLIVSVISSYFFDATPTVSNTGQSLTWALEGVEGDANPESLVAIYSAVAGSTGTITVDFVAASGVSRAGTVYVYSSSESGAFIGGPATGAPSLAITTEAANSDIVVGLYDEAANGSRTWRQVNGASPTESLYTSNAPFGVFYGARYTDAGAVGSKTVGLTAPSTFSGGAIGALEIKAASGSGRPVIFAGLRQRMNN
jgi:hypothetical protein